MTDFPADSTLACAVAASPNHGERKDGKRADAIILHYTGMATGESAQELLRHAASEVSCHYLVWEDGRVTQLVPEARRAWHAGRGVWHGETDMNSRSIGIEIVHPGHPGGQADSSMAPFPLRQVAAVTALCADICERHHIELWRLLAHSDIAPARKIDPGERSPWARLHRHGVGHFAHARRPGPAGEGLGMGDNGPYVAELQRLLAAYGYGVPRTAVFDSATHTVVQAFQRHFRPARVDGVADKSTLLVLRKLLAALPLECSAGTLDASA